MLLHLVHGMIIGVGAVVVVAMLLPTRWRHRRSLTELKTAAAAGTVVERAELRAAAELSEVGDASDRALDRPRSQSGRGWLVAAALASVVAAIVHGAVGPQHFEEGLRFGLFFVVLCTTQLAFAVLIVRRPSCGLVAANLLINLMTVLIWSLTRTVGLPFGLAEVESVGWLDIVATAAEVLLIACCGIWLLTSRAPRVATASVPRVSRPAPLRRAG